MPESQVTDFRRFLAEVGDGLSGDGELINSVRLCFSPSPSPYFPIRCPVKVPVLLVSAPATYLVLNHPDVSERSLP
jgi:hypothetical protein